MIASKLNVIAENMPKVYNAGYEKGKSEGGTDNYYDTFWDSFQQNGIARLSHSFFAGEGWTFESFKPKYDMVVANATNLFYLAGRLSGDFAAHLEQLGVTIDFSKVSTMNNTFYGCKNITRLPEINASKCGSLNSTFGECTNLVTIDKLILSTQSNLKLYTIFKNCEKLQNITFERTHLSFDVNIAQSPLLQPETVKHIISLLFKATGTSVEGKYTLSLSSTAWDNLETASPRDDGLTWKEYVQNLGWLI